MALLLGCMVVYACTLTYLSCDLLMLAVVQYLDVSNNMVTDVSALSKCPSLVQVDLSFNAIEVNTPHPPP